MPGIDIVIPWRNGDLHRERALDWMTSRLEGLGWTVVLGRAPRGPWRKALAVEDGLRRSTADVVVVADADVWCDEVGRAIEAAASGPSWAVPHKNVYRLGPAATLAVYAGAEPCDLISKEWLDQKPYLGTVGGGIVVLRRELGLEVPMDPRFEGWGGEDAAWGHALRHAAGTPWRGDSDLYHLWHPPQERQSRSLGSMQNWELMRDYAIASSAPNTMRALVAGARRALDQEMAMTDRKAS